VPQVEFQKPVEDSIAKINDEVAVGEDLDFQRSWWKFETAVWWCFTLIVVLAVLGAFGKGPLAKATAANSAMTVKYDRIERAGTPSILHIDFDPSAIQKGIVTLYISQSVTGDLGAQRVIPSPQTSTIGQGGITYVFPASNSPATVEFALQPHSPGIFHFTVQVPQAPPIEERVIVVP
jgi:hypothetical protein